MMATLAPRQGDRYLHSAEVIGRVKAAFAYVETTKDGAREELLQWMSQLAFVAADGRAEVYDEDLARLEELQDAALYVYFGDDLGSDGTLLSMLMVPRQPLFVDQVSDVSEKEAHALVARCAAALGYEVVEV